MWKGKDERYGFCPICKKYYDLELDGNHCPECEKEK